MNLGKKKKLAKRTFGIGIDRIIFVESKMDELKDAITKQDIRDLHKRGAIVLLERKGRKRVRKKKSRSTGNVRKKVNKRKKEYVLLTRKLRKYVEGEKSLGNLSEEDRKELRKKIRNRDFRSKSHLKEHLGGRKK